MQNPCWFGFSSKESQFSIFISVPLNFMEGEVKRYCSDKGQFYQTERCRKSFNEVNKNIYGYKHIKDKRFRKNQNAYI